MLAREPARKGFLPRVGQAATGASDGGTSHPGAQSGVRALGPCSASVGEPTLRLVGPVARGRAGRHHRRARPRGGERRQHLAARRGRRRRRHPPGRRARAARGVPPARRLRLRRRESDIRASNLPARFVIHTVGPVWSGGDARRGPPARQLLPPLPRGRRRDRRPSVAFPAISTGAYGYPVAEATKIAVATVRATITSVELVRFVCFDAAVHEQYLRELDSPDPTSVARRCGQRASGVRNARARREARVSWRGGGCGGGRGSRPARSRRGCRRW